MFFALGNRCQVHEDVGMPEAGGKRPPIPIARFSQAIAPETQVGEVLHDKTVAAIERKRAGERSLGPVRIPRHLIDAVLNERPHVDAIFWIDGAR